MDSSHEQLKRILQLALHSPYEGERSKAVALLLQKLERANLTLADLDPSFNPQDSVNTLRIRADVPYDFEVVLRSHEEACLYDGLLKCHPETSSTWLEGHKLLCRASASVKKETDQLLADNLPLLHSKLANAQKEALAEYQRKRQMLFATVVAEEISRISENLSSSG